jgi:tetratricopeptide (TPR) repeat protein
MHLALIVCSALSGVLALVVGVPIAKPELDRWPRLAWIDRSRIFIASAAFLLTIVSGVLSVVTAQRSDRTGDRSEGTDSLKTTLDAVQSEIVDASTSNAGEALRFSRLGDQLVNAKEFAAAATAYRKSVESMPTKSALTNLAVALRYSSDSNGSIEAARRAISIPPFDNIVHATALLQLAIGLTEMGKRDEAWLHLTEALRRFREAHDPLGIGDAEYARGVFEIRGGNADAAVPWLESAQMRFVSQNDKPRQATVMNVVGVMKLDAGETDEGIQALTAAVAIFRETGNTTDEAGALMNIGTARLDRCELADALSAYSESAAAAKRANNFAVAALAVANQAGVILEDGKLGAARQKAQEALGLCQIVISPEAEGWAHLHIATAWNRERRFEDAQAEAEIARTKFVNVNPIGFLAATLEEARVASHTGRYREASELLKDAEAKAASLHFELYRPSVLVGVSELREAQGNRVKAREMDARPERHDPPGQHARGADDCVRHLPSQWHPQLWRAADRTVARHVGQQSTVTI